MQKTIVRKMMNNTQKNKFNIFSGNPLDRLHVIRSDESKIEQLLQSSNALFLPFFNTKPLLCSNSTISWQQRKSVEQFLPPNSNPNGTIVLLGEKDRNYYFAFDTNHPDPSTFSSDAEYSNLREAALILSAPDAAILAQAKSLIEWNSNHRYCGSCGSRTVSKEGGIKRQCTHSEPTLPDQQNKSNSNHCGKSIYPRTDPVVIMLVIYQDKVLLGRKKEWPKGMYSCLAGFIDSGETIEEAVKREVKEEAGVHVETENVHYFSSQPWPFLGGQLMIGCHAYASSNDISVDQQELDEAGWFGIEQVRTGLANCFDFKSDFRLPPQLAIAHMLCKSWVEDQHFKPSL